MPVGVEQRYRAPLARVGVDFPAPFAHQGVAVALRELHVDVLEQVPCTNRRVSLSVAIMGRALSAESARGQAGRRLTRGERPMFCAGNHRSWPLAVLNGEDACSPGARRRLSCLSFEEARPARLMSHPLCRRRARCCCAFRGVSLSNEDVQ